MDIRVFIFKRKFFWIGWILKKNTETVPLYYDSTPSIEIYPESTIEYVTLGLSYKNVFKRLKNYAIACEKGEQHGWND